MSEQIRRSNNSNGYGKMIVAVTLICIAGFLFVKKGCSNGMPGFLSGDDETFTEIPKELVINYKAKDFKININEADAVRVLENPGRYRQEFDDLVYKINRSMLEHVISRMNLPVDIRAKATREYEKHHDYLKGLYFYDFLALKDTTAQLYELWYNNDANEAVDVLYEVASKYSCFMVNHVLSTLLKTKEGQIYVKGRKVETPCGVAMQESLQPIINKLKERAAVQDFTTSKGLMEERVETVIAELATLEVRDKKGINKELKTKIWGYKVSSTEVEISAISVMKIGFKLDNYFNIEVLDAKKEVVVTLPEPIILSHEVYPKVEKLDIGWMREIEDNDFNENFNVLRREFRKDAEEQNVFEKSKNQVESLMESMLEPVVNSISKKYKLRIKFKSTSKPLAG